MMKEEFAKLIGVEESEITEDIYKEVEQLYLAAGESKQEFCDKAKAENLLFKLALKETKNVRAWIDNLRAHHNGPAGTNMSVADYGELKDAAKHDSSSTLSDAEAALLVSREFGFEATRIKILHEAEINQTEPGSIYLKIKKVPRVPLKVSTDWNYVRFNVHTAPSEWFYEMVNGNLYPVSI
jgi:hypothetical protein